MEVTGVTANSLTVFYGLPSGSLSRYLHGKIDLSFKNVCKLWPFVYGCDFPFISPITIPTTSPGTESGKEDAHACAHRLGRDGHCGHLGHCVLLRWFAEVLKQHDSHIPPALSDSDHPEGQ